MSETTVFVTGATGFAASQTIKQLLELGYTVIGSVRDELKGELLVKRFNDSKFSYATIPSFVTKEPFAKVLTEHPEITVFLHVASPVTIHIESLEDDILRPAIDGTVNALKDSKKYGLQITNFVYTSSNVAMFPIQLDAGVVPNEDSWNAATWEESLVNYFTAYCASKYLAEKSAWDFVKNENPNFVFNLVNPALIVGPQTFDEDAKKDELNFSANVIKQLLFLKQDDAVPNMDGFAIDVRDVAKAHIAAFENVNIKNERLLVQNETYCTQTVVDIIHENFPDLHKKLPLGDSKAGKDLVKNHHQVDNSKTRKLLGFDFIPLEKSIVDAVSQIIG